eukprot:scaffold10429_cov126-Cylindrotheca_fusiformis.AAC.8
MPLGADAQAAERVIVKAATVPTAASPIALLVDAQIAGPQPMDHPVRAQPVPIPIVLPVPAQAVRKDTAPLANVLAAECKETHLRLRELIGKVRSTANSVEFYYDIM